MEKTIRTCHICWVKPAITREHLPAKATANRGKIQVRYIDGKRMSEGLVRSFREFDDGFVVEALCEKCNKYRTGLRLGGPYKNFISQINEASGIEDEKGRIYVKVKQIYPLRIIKQMFSMFLCALPKQPFAKWNNLQKFVLDKDMKLFDEAPQIYLYKNISRWGRIVPWGSMAEIMTARKPIAIAEVSWPPLGIIFCDKEDERFSNMENITGWGKYAFRDKIDFVMQLPKLKVNGEFPLAFGTNQEVEHWQTANGVVWAIAAAEDDYKESPNNIGMIMKR